MSDKPKVSLEVNINIPAVEAAARNAGSIKDVALEIPVVDPRKLTIDSQIFGFSVRPVNDEVKKLKPSTLRYVAIKPVLVNNLSSTIKEGFITVNGDVDIPRESGRVIGIEQAFLQDEEDAKAVAEVLTLSELERAEAMVEEASLARDFLKKQYEDRRY